MQDARSFVRAIRMVQVIVFCNSASIVFAAQQVMFLPEQIPAMQYVYAGMLSLTGGLANAIQRWAKGSEEGKTWLLFARDIVCSLSAGMLAFFAVVYIAPPPALAAIAVYAAGYGGSRFLEFAYSKVESRIGREMEK